MSQIGDVFAARSNPARESSRMIQGWREKVDEARRFCERYDRIQEIENLGVVVTAEEIVEFMRGVQR